MEIQTETEVQAKPPPKKDNEDLIRLQSSMSIMQEDHLKERKLLNEKIAQLQHVIDQNKVADQSQQKDCVKQNVFQFIIDPIRGIICRVEFWSEFRSVPYWRLKFEIVFSIGKYTEDDCIILERLGPKRIWRILRPRKSLCRMFH